MKFIWQKLKLYLLPSIDINNEYYVIQNEETNFPLVITSFYVQKVCKLIWCSSCWRLFHTLVEIMFSRITFYHTHWERIQATWLNRVFTSSWLYFVACLFLGSWLFQETFRMKQKVFVTTRVFGAVFIWNMAYLR